MGNKTPENTQLADRQPASGKEDISGLSLKLKQALESRESRDSLRKIGDSLYESFKGPEYSPDIVLSSVKEVYEENRNNFKPPLVLNGFIQSFGPGMVKLCQQKLVDAKGFDLGKYGPRGDGVDGKLGRMTGNAIKRYYENQPGVKNAETPVSASNSEPATALPHALPKETSAAPAAKPSAAAQPGTPPSAAETSAPLESSQTLDLGPYKPGTEKPTFTPVSPLKRRITEIYDRQNSTYTTDTMPNQLGRSRERIEPYLTNIDPFTGDTLTFLGRPFMKPPAGGLNLMAIPFLKIAEEKISAAKINYKPANTKYKGYDFRGLKIGGVPSKEIMSSHSFGMAFDIDASNNMPINGRGNIPDEVVMALVESGFAWGSVPYPGFHFAADPMHFQLRFNPRDQAGQAIINSSATGKKYWEKVKPLMDGVDQRGVS